MHAASANDQRVILARRDLRACLARQARIFPAIAFVSRAASELTIPKATERYSALTGDAATDDDVA